MTRLFLAALVLFVGCGPPALEPPSHNALVPQVAVAVEFYEQRGGPEDVRIEAVHQPAYDIVVECARDGVGVLGHGTVVMGSREEAALFNQRAGALRSQLESALGDTAVGVGWGLGCQDAEHVGPRVYAANYRTFDEAVRRTAAFVEAEDLGVPIFVLVVPVVSLD
ncbi:MAG: hypothetical protein AB8I08_09445 [Sandaracinaceae bacterium]